jgi:hypothetical protein
MRNPKRRFDVTMSPEFAEQFAQTAKENGMIRAEVFRRAIALYKRAKEVTMAGGSVLLEENGITRQIIGI